MTTVAQNRWIELITIESAIETVGSNQYPYLKLQRYLYDPVPYSTLKVQQLIWQRGLNMSDYNAFLLHDGTLSYVLPAYDCIACNTIGPTIVAIKKDVVAPLTRIMNKINRSGILPQRISAV